MDDSNEDQRTVWCGNLSDKVTEEILYELFLQAAPLEKVRIPKDKDGKHLSYGFITFKHLVSVKYAIELLNGTALYDKKINIKPRNSNNVQRQNSHHRDNSPVCMQLQHTNPQNMLGTIQGINMLMQMGNQLLINNKVHSSNLDNSYHQNVRSPAPYHRWEHSNYRDDRRENSRPYRRHTGHYNSDRYNSNNNNTNTSYHGTRRYDRRI